MATDVNYFNFIREQLSPLENVSFRKMMGEYIVYCEGKVVGGIYDNRLLIKPTTSAKSMMADAEYVLPYDGAKEMILVSELEDREFLSQLILSVANDIPTKKK